MNIMIAYQYFRILKKCRFCVGSALPDWQHSGEWVMLRLVFGKCIKINMK